MAGDVANAIDGLSDDVSITPPATVAVASSASLGSLADAAFTADRIVAHSNFDTVFARLAASAGESRLDMVINEAISSVSPSIRPGYDAYPEAIPVPLGRARLLAGDAPEASSTTPTIPSVEDNIQWTNSKLAASGFDLGSSLSDVIVNSNGDGIRYFANGAVRFKSGGSIAVYNREANTVAWYLRDHTNDALTSSSDPYQVDSFAESPLVNAPEHYQRRPTLVVLTPGANFNGVGANGEGRALFQWQHDMADELAYELNAAGSQVHVMQIDWASTKPNTSAAEQVANHIRSWLKDNAETWDVVLVGHSRGAVFNHEVAHNLGDPGNMMSLQNIMLDPTAAVSMGDQYPTQITGNVDYGVVYDDGYQLFPLGLVKDSTPVAGAEYHRVSLPGIGYYDTGSSHKAMPDWYAKGAYKDDLAWLLRENDRIEDAPFDHNDRAGFEKVVVSSPDDANRIIDVGFDSNQDGDAHGFISILGVGGADLIIGKSGVIISAGGSIVGNVAFSAGQEAVTFSTQGPGAGPVNVGGGFIITEDETRVDVDLGPMHVSLFGEGAGIYFGGKKLEFKSSSTMVAGVVQFERLRAGGEKIVETFRDGVATLREEFLAGGLKISTTLIGAVPQKTFEWLLESVDPAAVGETLRTLSTGDLAEAVRTLPVDCVHDVLQAVDAYALPSVIRALDTEQLTTVLGSAAERMTNAVFDAVGVKQFRDVFGGFSTKRRAEVLERLAHGKLEDVLEQLSPAAVASTLEHASGALVEAALSALPVKKAAAVVERLSGEVLDAVVDRLTSSKLAATLTYVDGATLKEALKRLSDTKAGQVLSRFDGGTLEAALERMSPGRIASVLAGVDGDTLKASLKRMSDKVVSSVLEQFDGDTLKASLARMSASRVADVLNRVDTATLKEALKRMDVDKVKDVVGKLDQQVNRLANDFLKKLNPSKYKNAIGTVISNADPRTKVKAHL